MKKVITGWSQKETLVDLDQFSPFPTLGTHIDPLIETYEGRELVPESGQEMAADASSEEKNMQQRRYS